MDKIAANGKRPISDDALISRKVLGALQKIHAANKDWRPVEAGIIKASRRGQYFHILGQLELVTDMIKVADISQRDTIRYGGDKSLYLYEMISGYSYFLIVCKSLRQSLFTTLRLARVSKDPNRLLLPRLLRLTTKWYRRLREEVNLLRALRPELSFFTSEEKEALVKEMNLLRCQVPDYPPSNSEGCWTTDAIATWACAKWGGNPKKMLSRVNHWKRKVCPELAISQGFQPTIYESDMKKIVDAMRENTQAAKRARR